jgi:hypothetical protein
VWRRADPGRSAAFTFVVAAEMFYGAPMFLAIALVAKLLGPVLVGPVPGQAPAATTSASDSER